MRYSALTLALLAIVAVTPAIAQDVSPGLVVSGFNCRQPMACDLDNGRTPAPDEMLSIGDSCVSRYMGNKSGISAFLDGGLDGNYCLATNAAAFPAGEKASMQPVCCLKTVGKGQCILSCNIISM